MEVMMVVMMVKVVIISSIVIKSTGYNLKKYGVNDGHFVSIAERVAAQVVCACLFLSIFVVLMLFL